MPGYIWPLCRERGIKKRESKDRQKGQAKKRVISKFQAVFFRFCDIAIIVECTATHVQPPNIP